MVPAQNQMVPAQNYFGKLKAIENGENAEQFDKDDLIQNPPNQHPFDQASVHVS